MAHFPFNPARHGCLMQSLPDMASLCHAFALLTWVENAVLGTLKDPSIAALLFGCSEACTAVSSLSDTACAGKYPAQGTNPLTLPTSAACTAVNPAPVAQGGRRLSAYAGPAVICQPAVSTTTVATPCMAYYGCSGSVDAGETLDSRGPLNA